MKLLFVKDEQSCERNEKQSVLWSTLSLYQYLCCIGEAGRAMEAGRLFLLFSLDLLFISILMQRFRVRIWL
jgi:hypothetical protein